MLRRETLDALESLKQFPNIVPVRLVPKEDFITMMVERGYPAPRPRFRWCMARLKLRPMQEFMSKLGRYVQVSGVRAGESSDRIRRYGELTKFVNSSNPLVMPILDWTVNDVFTYLRTRRRWDGKDFNYLLDLYEVKECDVFIANVRFGCWVCTVVSNDKMPTPPILKWARQKLLEISSDPRMREFDESGRPRKLNGLGRREVARVFLEVAEKYPEALGYDINELKDKLRKIIYGDFTTS